jgi:hypothetical protein
VTPWNNRGDESSAKWRQQVERVATGPLTEQEMIEYLHEINNTELSDFEFESDSGSSNIGSVINSDSENGEASHMARKNNALIHLCFNGKVALLPQQNKILTTVFLAFKMVKFRMNLQL